MDQVLTDQTRTSTAPSFQHPPDKEDPASKRPRLQAQRKFAQSPPNSPGPSVSMTSPRNNHTLSQAAGTCLTRRRPKTEDFLSFLCLRGSAALPNNMAFLASGRAKEPTNSQHPASSLSTNHRTAAQGKNIRLFSRTTVQRDSASQRGSGRPPAVRSFCPLTARAERRRERERREEEQQRRRSKGVEEDRKEGAERHLLRRRQLPLQVRRNKVAMASGFSQRRASLVRSVPPSKPSTGVRSRGAPRPSKRPGSTCKPKGHPTSRPKETNSRRLPRQPSNQELPRHHPPPPHRRTVPDCCSKPKTPSSLQNSGRNSSRSLAHIPLTNGSVSRQLSEDPGSLRVSRRKRGLPPDTSPAPVHPQSNNTSRKCQTQQYNHAPVESAEVSKRETGCLKVNRAEDVSHDEELGNQRGAEELSSQTDGCVSEDGPVERDAGESSLESVRSVEPSGERVHTSTNCDPGPVSEVIRRHVREKRIQRNQPASSTPPKPITRTTESRARAARTTVTKAAINSVTSAPPDPPATYSAKHTAKGPNKGPSKDLTKCTSPASRFSTHHSKGAAKDSSKDTTGDSTKDSSSTSKGSTKGLTEPKSTTSAIKTRTSPRILQKR
ncbi:protein Jumonji-like [Notolabrus celidotus]|uniref:protein Jumonji-like n=1 Tax=Notolabrus celidotus TaxID=1203425 RepID=UPI00148F9183|nr:protein Jumonji-like [Notolabrus celidotus]